MDAPALGIDPGDIRVIQPPRPSATSTLRTDRAALLAKTEPPVKVTTRARRNGASPTREPRCIHIRTGCTRTTACSHSARRRCCNGQLAPAPRGEPTIPVIMMRTTSGHYRAGGPVQRAQAIYTNNPYAGSFRGYGNVEPRATARQMDMLAKWSMDPLAFRRKTPSCREKGPRRRNRFCAECANKISLRKPPPGRVTQPQTQDVRGAARPGLGRGHRPRLVDPQRRRRQDP